MPLLQGSPLASTSSDVCLGPSGDIGEKLRRGQIQDSLEGAPRAESTGLEGQEPLLAGLGLPLNCCVTLGKLLTLSGLSVFLSVKIR